MSPSPLEALLEQARRLDAEAIGVGEDGERGRALRAQAAALRVSALGERDYPVLICSTCFRLTGWTTAAGSCHRCAVHAALRAADAASGGWGQTFASSYPQKRPAPTVPLGVRIASRLGRRRSLAAATSHAWMEHVEPGDTGPIEPELGFAIESAIRDEVERIDGSGILVRFATATHRFGGGGWERLPTTTISTATMPNPSEFAAELPIETLVEAWGDYQQALAVINRRSWSAASEARESARIAQADHEQALREQQHTSELLHE